ncbi:MAG: hypothetical protein AB7K71_04665 [Polyangiaceae bacterium]
MRLGFAAFVACSKVGRSLVELRWISGRLIHLQYDFHTDSTKVKPYVAYGLGYESVSLQGSTGGSTSMNASFEGALSGLNLAMPELGIDIPLGKHASFLLFATAKLGKYTNRSGTLSAGSAEINAAYGSPDFHRWFGAGIGLSYF